MKNEILIAAIGAGFQMSTAFASSDAHWTYHVHAIPAQWAGLDQNFLTCRTGKNQSPITTKAREIKAGALKPIDSSCQELRQK
jgi:carbonic anhydrase